MAGRSFSIDSTPPLFHPTLPVEFYSRDVLEVAEDLVGCLVSRHHMGNLLVGRIVETEAYRQSDPASHSYAGRTGRNGSMFGPVAHAYVYLSYGIHHCFNVVCGSGRSADAVLIRAVEPVAGLGIMWENRYGSTAPPDIIHESAPGFQRKVPRSVRDLASGPGRLSQALHITRETVDGTSLLTGPVTIHPGSPAGPVATTPRIGITKAADLPWRFAEQGSLFLSRPVG